MTNEIIKKLEDVRYHLVGSGHKAVIDETIEHIKKQELEIVKWHETNIKLLQRMPELAEITRAEAIKEFGEKVKDICRPFPMHDDYECMTIYHQDIDNLVKEWQVIE